MTWVLAAALYLAFTAAPQDRAAAAQAEPEVSLEELMSAAMTEYTGCLKATARRLEPSGEPAASVAESAFTACAKERGDVLLVVRVHAIRRQGISEDRAPSVARGAMTQVDDALKREVILEVTEQRAAKASSR